MTRAADSIDLADVFRSLQRGWRTIAFYTLGGLLAGLAVLLFAPRRYQASASVVLKSAEPLSALSRLAGGMGAGALGEGAASALTGARSPMETELEILRSGAVAQRVIDSLRLQARITSPDGVAPAQVFAHLSVPGSFRPVKVTILREGGGGQARFRVRGDSLDVVVAPGQTFALRGGQAALRPDAPAQVTLKLLDREDATERFQKRLSVAKASGEVARVTFRADDSLTAALAPNTLLATYLARRKTTDRGVNQHRVEFLTAQLDSTARELASAERALRQFQESSGVLNAEALGRVQLERGADLRKQLLALEVEQGAIDQLLGQVEAGTLDRRQLAAYPTFLRSSSMSDLITQLSTLEAERLQLLERRTERDPEVVAITQSIAAIEGQFMPMARSYSIALARQRQDLGLQLDTLRRELGVLPGAAESGNRLQRDVIRLGAIYAAMQGQLVEARLGAIAEGGDVRQLDVAMPPKKPAFPKPAVTLGTGGAAGMFFGIVAALALSVFGRWARDPAEIERTTGVPTLRLDRRAPLIVANGASRAVLVVPLHAQADTLGVARQIVETSLSRGTTATLLDLGDPAAVRDAARGVDVNGAIERLASEFATVVVRLPALTSDATLTALRQQRPVVFVVPAGRVEREQLSSAMETLRRLDVPCAGIVVSSAPMVGAGEQRGMHALPV